MTSGRARINVIRTIFSKESALCTGKDEDVIGEIDEARWSDMRPRCLFQLIRRMNPRNPAFDPETGQNAF
jgi:outer membrane lipopolysaccharide assembly protein LptE/RlpB